MTIKTNFVLLSRRNSLIDSKKWYNITIFLLKGDLLMRVHTAEDLGKAVKNEEDTIEIEGDLVKKTLRIKATGKVAWAIAIGAIGVAVAALVLAPATSGGTVVVEAFAAPAAVGVLGLPTTLAAISIAVAGGGVAVLNKLRHYKIVEQSDNYLVLKRK